MDIDCDFDFRFHSDRSSLTGTQYFELLPGRYVGGHWVEGARFVHEYTFCLFEGIFEKHVPDYDHFGSVEVGRPQWQPILADIATLISDLRKPEGTGSLPYGSTLDVQGVFEREFSTNRRALAALMVEVNDWVRQTVTVHDCVSVLGL